MFIFVLSFGLIWKLKIDNAEIVSKTRYTHGSWILIFSWSMLDIFLVNVFNKLFNISFEI